MATAKQQVNKQPDTAAKQELEAQLAKQQQELEAQQKALEAKKLKVESDEDAPKTSVGEELSARIAELEKREAAIAEKEKANASEIEVIKASYKVKESEKHLFHSLTYKRVSVLGELRNFDIRTHRTKPKVFSQFKQNAEKYQGMTVEVLHDPTA